MSKTHISKQRYLDPTMVGFAEGTSDYVAEVYPVPSEYATGQRYQVRAESTSTGNISLDAGQGPLKVFKTPTVQATTSDWSEGQWYMLVLDMDLDSGSGGFSMTGSGGGGGGGGGSVETVTGPFVDNSDPANPFVAIDAWDASNPGVVEKSSKSEAENIPTQAAAGTATDLSESRTPSEVGMKDMLVQLFNTAVTWVSKLTLTALPRLSGATASTILGVDSNKDVISVARSTTAQALATSDSTVLLTPASMSLFESIVDLGNVSGSVTVDLSTGRLFKMVATGNITSFGFSGAKVGARYIFRIETGSSDKTISFASSSFDWSNGSLAPPQLTECTKNGTSPAKAVDYFEAVCYESGRLVIGQMPNTLPN